MRRFTRFIAIVSRSAFIATLVITVAPPTSSSVSAVVGGTSAVGNTAVVRIINGTSVCSGALWRPRIVITAAHCVVDSSGVVTGSPLRIFAPGVDVLLNQTYATQIGIVTVDGWQRKGTNSQADDIAFVVLDRDWLGTSITRLATTAEVVQWSSDNREVTFLGYGRTTPTSTSSATPNAINQSLTRTIFFDFAGSFTAAQTSTTGMCSGDSGGPSIATVGDKTVLIGINSAASGPCFASTSPSITGFMPSAFPDLVNRALQLAGDDLIIPPLIIPPVVSDENISSVASTSVELRATVKATTEVVQAVFQYSRESDFSSIEGSFAAGEVLKNDSATLSVIVPGLRGGVTYYWQLIANTATGVISGSTQTFVTPTFQGATSISTRSLLAKLVISQEAGTTLSVTPISKSRSVCTFNSRTNRLVFLRSGVCRVKVSTAINQNTTIRTLTLIVL